MIFSRMVRIAAVSGLALAILPAGAMAQSSAPAPVAPAAPPVMSPAPVATTPAKPAVSDATPTTLTVQPAPPAPNPNPVMAWSLANAQALVTVIEGIGKDLAEKVATLCQTGSLPMLKELLAEIPESVLAILRVPGLG